MISVSRLSLIAVACAALMTGCASSGGSSASGVNNPFSKSNSSTLGSVQVNTMRTFGDSYSDPAWTGSTGTSNWTQLLTARGLVANNANYAIGGARASVGEIRGLSDQIDNAFSANKPIVDGDLTVIYLGYNDIGRNGSPDGLRRATTGYKNGVARLIEAGAANDNRRIFVTQITNWSRAPGVSWGTGNQVRAWNAMLAELANTNPNIVAVDLYTAFERIFLAPETYGFTNVTTASPSRSAIDALFNDQIHYGSRGQEVISRVYQHYLTRGWDWANSVSAGVQSASQINKDIDDGTLVLGMAGQQPLKYGFRLLPLGVDEVNGLTFRPSSSNVFRPFAAPSTFAQTAPSGLALDVGLGSDAHPDAGRVGVAVFQYQQPNKLQSGQEQTMRRYTSNALSLYWRQPVGGLDFSSQLSHLNLNFDSQAQDTWVNLNLQNRSQGDTWSLENKLRYPLSTAGWNVTPWVSLTSQTHKLDAATYTSLYTTDVHFSGNRMNELLTGVGVDLQSTPMYLGGGRQIQFGGSLHHLTSLYRDAIRVSMAEAGSPGVVQSEVFSTPRLNQTQLGLQATMDVNRQVRFSATYGTQLQNVKNTSSVALLAHFRY